MRMEAEEEVTVDPFAQVSEGLALTFAPVPLYRKLDEDKEKALLL